MIVAAGRGDALLIVDLQNDFLPGGSLAVAGGEAVVPVLNHYIEWAGRNRLAVIASRDWHPRNHCSFRENGGGWPAHCVAESSGAQIAAGLLLPAGTLLVDKGTQPTADAYSAFDGTVLAGRLRERSITRLLVGGLATDYCVLYTVLDARKAGFDVVVLTDAIRAVELKAGDGLRAQQQMRAAGAAAATLADLAP